MGPSGNRLKAKVFHSPKKVRPVQSDDCTGVTLRVSHIVAPLVWSRALPQGELLSTYGYCSASLRGVCWKMAQRTILIQSKTHLSIKHGLLCITVEDGTCATVPLEDVWVVIIESHITTITVACMSKLMDAGIGLMVCGRDHMPNGLLLPLGAHSRHAGIVEDQLAMSLPFKKQLWKRIVEVKIINQAEVLDQMGISGDALRGYAKSVTSGDKDNREGAAAAEYFKCLIADGTRRSSAESAALDYGYGVLRAGIGRAAVGGGWLVSQGIHHHSVYNAFNLVDDLIEPFRPLIDLIVMSYGLEEPLEPKDKALLARVFEHVMTIDGKRCGCQQCIEMMLASLRTAVLDKDPKKLLLPRLEGLELVKME